MLVGRGRMLVGRGSGVVSGRRRGGWGEHEGKKNAQASMTDS